MNLIASTDLMTRLCTIDSMLFDIPVAEDGMPKQMTPLKNLLINNISDLHAHKMMHFYVKQLQQLYKQFGFRRWAHEQNGSNEDIRLKFFTEKKIKTVLNAATASTQRRLLSS